MEEFESFPYFHIELDKRLSKRLVLKSVTTTPTELEMYLVKGTKFYVYRYEHKTKRLYTFGIFNDGLPEEDLKIIRKIVTAI